MAERVLTLKELNRATLARQFLLERKRVGAVAMIERLVGMQAQWPPSPYIGLWTRVAGFKRESLEGAILRGEVIKATVMRGTLHLVSRRDYALLWALLHEKPFWADAEAVEAAARVAPTLRKLALAGPVAIADVLEHLEQEHGLVDRPARHTWFVSRIRAHVVHAPETALWSGRPQARYVAGDEPDRVDRLAAATEIVRRYLAAFGPATRADIAEWGGLLVKDVQPALDALEPLRRFRDESGRELLDLPRAPLPPPDTPAPVRFLPKWDNVLLGHKDSRRIVSDEYRKIIVATNGDVGLTFLVDGVVAGKWSYDKQGRVAVEPFAPLPRAARREVDDEAARVQAWLQ